MRTPGPALASPTPTDLPSITLRDAIAATAVAVAWGLAFVATKIGLEVFTPAQLTVMRFGVACSAALWVPRPRLPLATLLAIGLTLFTGQFLLQFYGVTLGMPAGLTSVVSQSQALFTVALAAVVLRERPSVQQATGMLIAVVGLIIIGAALGLAIPLLAFLVTLCSALSWAIGNVLVKRLPPTDMLSLMVWASIVPPLPALALSLALDPPASIPTAIERATWLHWSVPVYLGLVASVIAYSIWGRLLRRYPSGAVAPFALLAPCVGTLTSAVLLNERFSIGQLLGMGCVLLGVLLAVVRIRARSA